MVRSFGGFYEVGNNVRNASEVLAKIEGKRIYNLVFAQKRKSHPREWGGWFGQIQVRDSRKRQAEEALAKVSKKTTGVSVKELLPRSRG